MAEPTLDSRLAVREYPTDSIPLMEQKWRNLLFLHWEYDPKEIQKSLPKGLHVDLFEGKAYIGVTPFFMKDVRIKLMPAIPGLSDFQELNFRTYVYDDKGTPGVWFYSLDANSMLAVQMASSFFYLPYFYAEMEFKNIPEGIYYRCQRKDQANSVEYIYQSIGNQWIAEPGTLEFFLMERYALFAHKGNNEIAIGRIHHTPYPLYQAEVSKWGDEIFIWNGLQRPARAPDHVCFSPGVNVEIFSLNDVASR